jgi:HEPN domain-containing protein
MSVDDDREHIVGEWLDAARGDLRMADVLLRAEDVEPWGIAFHAQQAIEKSLKAILAHDGVAVPRTHDLMDLVGRVAPRWKPPLDEDSMDRITDFAVATRYPIDDWSPSVAADAGRSTPCRPGCRARCRRDRGSPLDTPTSAYGPQVGAK